MQACQVRRRRQGLFYPTASQLALIRSMGMILRRLVGNEQAVHLRPELPKWTAGGLNESVRGITFITSSSLVQAQVLRALYGVET